MYGHLTLPQLCGRLSGTAAKGWTAEEATQRHSQKCQGPRGIYARAALAPKSLVVTLYSRVGEPMLSGHVFDAATASAGLVGALARPRLSDLAVAAHSYATRCLGNVPDRPLSAEEQQTFELLRLAAS